MEEDSLRVMCLCFGLVTALRMFTMSSKIPISSQKNQHQSDNIFGRYIDFESRNVINSHESRHDHLSSAEFGLYNKYKDINFAAMPENRISGNGDRFSQNEFPIETREDKKGCQNFS